MKAQMQKGFTLIELMIVVAIIGILAAVAIPAYQDYTARAQMTEAFSMTSGMKTSIAEYAQINGAYPTDTTTPNIDDLAVEGTYADAEVETATGIITVTMKEAGTVSAGVADGVVLLTPPQDLSDATTSFVFECTSTTIDQKYLPKSCVSTITP